MTKRLRLTVGAIACLALVSCGTSDESTPKPASSQVSAARDYLATAEPREYKVQGQAWQRGVIIMLRKVDDNWDDRLEITVLTPGEVGTKELIRTSDSLSVDELDALLSPGDYVAYLSGKDKRVSAKEVKVLRAAAVDIG